jgi:ATP-dependent Clp protease adaptor protein ClpS
MISNSQNKPKESKDYNPKLQSLYTLILFNDDVNAYDFVIDSLVEVCEHNRLQAEQCTLIAHHNGKCDVKSGELADLNAMKDELNRRGLSATIVSKS